MLSSTGKSPRKPPYLIINSRIVKSKSLSKAIKKLYDGSFPQGVVIINIDPSYVDVNVEVDKSAVICRNEADFISAVELIISGTILNLAATTSQNVTQDFYENNLNSSSVTTTPIISSNSSTEDTTVIPSHGQCNESRINNSSSVKPNLLTNKISKANLEKDNAEPGENKSQTNHEIPKSLIFQPSHSSSTRLSDSDSGSESHVSSSVQHVNLSIWDELEKELDSDCELFSSDGFEDVDKENVVHKLPNMIEKEELPKSGKQSTLMSWTQGRPEFKLEFISPEQIPKSDPTPKKRSKCVTSPFSANNEKRRKISTPSPTSKTKRNTLTFNFHHIKQQLLFRHPAYTKQTITPTAFKVDGNWLVIWENKLHAFNPNRAQEVNVYRKMLSSYSLKYTLTLPESTTTWTLTPSLMSRPSFQHLQTSPTTSDPLGESCFVSDKSLAINGIRIKKVHDGCFEVANVCSDVPGFGLDDVIETVDLIVENNTILSSKLVNSEVSVCDYSAVRCGKVRDYLKVKATKFGGTFSKFEPTSTDVMDLFFNTNNNDMCIHDKPFWKVIWSF